jgi:hypothetical protein
VRDCCLHVCGLSCDLAVCGSAISCSQNMLIMVRFNCQSYHCAFPTAKTSVATSLLQMLEREPEDAAARKRRLSREANQRWRQKADVKERERKRAAMHAAIRAARRAVTRRLDVHTQLCRRPCPDLHLRTWQKHHIRLCCELKQKRHAAPCFPRLHQAGVRGHGWHHADCASSCLHLVFNRLGESV